MRVETVKKAIGLLIDQAVETDKVLNGDLMLTGFQISAAFQGIEQKIGISWSHDGAYYGNYVTVGHHGIFNGFESEGGL